MSDAVRREQHGQRASSSLESRLEIIVSTIQEFAQLHFDARAPLGPDGDIVDAVAAGVNFLGEELDVAYAEIERRVAERTAELERATDELRRVARHDQLTGLPNRMLFWDRLNQRLTQSERRSEDFAVLFIDLDGFKGVNDTWGHSVGDQLLVRVADRIRSRLRTGDSAARIGGDEFLVLLDEVDSAESALGIAHRLCADLEAPFDIASTKRGVSATIGVAIGPANMASADELVNAADAAMYSAKHDGPGRCALYGLALEGNAEA
jgi:diguanylate cyclase (GGDEF)-like protein